MKRRGDDGVTLVELLVAMTLSALLATVIAAAFTVGVKTTDEANERLAGSQGAQITASFFPADVRSWDGAPTGASCAAATTVASFGWTDQAAAGAPVLKRADYCLVSGTQNDLIRRYWEDGVQTSSATLAHDISTASVACTPVPSCAAPVTATITVTEPGGFAFSVTGRRRTS